MLNAESKKMDTFLRIVMVLVLLVGSKIMLVVEIGEPFNKKLCFRETSNVSREYFFANPIHSRLTSHDSRLMSHQKHCIAKQQFSVFPETAEEWIFGEIDNAARAHFLGAEYETIFDFAFDF